MRDRSRPQRARLWTLLTAAILGACALALSAATPVLMHVVQPEPGAVVGIEGVEVMVHFAPEGRVSVETFRVLLNGADASSEFTTAANGAYGRLHSLLDGENLLRFEVFGRRWWLPGWLVEEAREVRILVRLPQGLDRG